jgi:hypothetical protein
MAVVVVAAVVHVYVAPDLLVPIVSNVHRDGMAHYVNVSAPEYHAISLFSPQLIDFV